jgi:small subunit ribosomal protein S6
MRKYEATYILRPDLEEEDMENAADRVKNVITDNGGEILKEDIWGSKSLAYEIDDYRSGHYTVLTFEAEGIVLNELKRNFKIMGGVLRHLVIRIED